MKYLILLTIFSCSFLGKGDLPSEKKMTYTYADVSGRYKLIRDRKFSKNKVVTRTQLIKPSGDKVLEKSITVSHLGSVKNKDGRALILRPEAAEFSVWLEGKNYFSRMSLDVKRKSLRLDLKSPEAKWNGTTLIPFPKGKYFCFYSQLPECLYHLKFLSATENNPDKEIGFYIIWDSFPYVQDQLSGVGQKIFAKASIKFEGPQKKLLRYVIEVEGQIILYDFSKSFELVKIAWISQGITVVPEGEEIPVSDLE